LSFCNLKNAADPGIIRINIEHKVTFIDIHYNYDVIKKNYLNLWY